MKAHSTARTLEPTAESTTGSARIHRIRSRYQTGEAWISVERARYFTASWKETQGSGLSQAERVATAMLHVYRNVTLYVDADDQIAGHWTENLLGVPIDIERGLFNTVLGAELTRWTMLKFRARSLTKSLSYMVSKGALQQFLRDQKASRAHGGAPLDLGLKTMDRRTINPFQIAAPDRHELLNDLLPWWQGKTLTDKLEKELAQAGLSSDDMREFALAVPGNTSRQVMMLSSCATIATMQGHLILDYDKVLLMGLNGMRREAEENLAATDAGSAEHAYLSALTLTLEGISTFADRLVSALTARAAQPVLDAEERQRVESMLHNCLQVPRLPARTFAEAVQSMWMIKTVVELAHPVNLHCFGRLDQILYPWYEQDLLNGTITEAAARELLEELLLKIMSQNVRPESNVLSHFYHRFFGSSPVTLAGVTPDGDDATNPLTYLFIEAAHRSRAITNVSVRIADSTPPEVLQKVAEKLYDGTSSYSLFNDRVNIEAMRRRGFSEADARDYAVMGCVETTSPGRTGSMSANALLLCRMLDITLRNGDSRTLAGTLHGDGLATGDPDSFTSFDQFVDAFLTQGRYFIEKIVTGSNIRDRVFAEMLPAPIISAFTDGCLDSRRDITQAGARYDLSGISMINSIANVTDSLLVIKKLIFEQKKVDFKTMRAALDANFVGYEPLAAAIDRLEGKWGNGSPEADQLAYRILRSLCDETYNHRSWKNAPFVVYAISMTTHTIDGRLSIATPDGRRAATPYAASANPANVERNGVTGALRSVAALPSDDLMGCAVNVRFHPSAIGHHAASRAKWAALVRTYFGLGGSQMQPTVASAEMLLQAKLHPDQYRDLIVKVGGYSTYFVDLGREIQDEIIARTEHCQS